MPVRSSAALAALSIAVGVLSAACSSSSGPASTADSTATIVAVGAENEYANVIGQIGGKYVNVTAIESNPNTDPHSFEASASVAQAVSRAELVVQHGLGYDTYMNKIEAATPGAKRVAGALAPVPPSHAVYYTANAAAFDRSLQPWYQAIAKFKAAYPGTPVATTEPVGDYLLQAAGADNLTPFTFQADVMNGVDPAPQYVSLENKLFSGRKVKVFLYNQQVTDSLTVS